MPTLAECLELIAEKDRATVAEMIGDDVLLAIDTQEESLNDLRAEVVEKGGVFVSQEQTDEQEGIAEVLAGITENRARGVGEGHYQQINIQAQLAAEARVAGDEEAVAQHHANIKEIANLIKNDVPAENSGAYDVTNEEVKAQLVKMQDLATDEELETIVSGNDIQRQEVISNLFNRSNYEDLKAKAVEVVGEEQADVWAQLIEVHAAAVGVTAEQYVADRGIILQKSEIDNQLPTSDADLFDENANQFAQSAEIQDRWGKELQSIHLSENGKDITLHSLIVKKEDQKSGIGSAFMQELIEHADQNGKRLLLSPGLKDDGHGTTSRGRLVKFYKRFGFVENKGRNKDFSISSGMYREPKDILKQDKSQTDQGTVKGAVEFSEGRAIIHAFESADVSTLVHELFHIFRRDLTGKDLSTIESWAGVENGVWTVAAEEKFARAGELYLREGKAPSTELEGIFEKLKNWLSEIYQVVKGSSLEVDISPEVRKVFDSMFTEQESANVTEGGTNVLQQVADLTNYKNWNPEQTKDGKYKGAPPVVETRSDLIKMRKTLAKLAREGLIGRYWYEESAKKVLEITRGNLVEAERVIQAIAIYSPQHNVKVNTWLAVRAYHQWKNGVSREDFRVNTETQDNKAIEALYDGVPFSGRKIDSFYLNLMHYIVEAHPEALDELTLSQDVIEQMAEPVTVDTWMYRSLGYPNDSYGSNPNGRTDAYSFTENHVLQLRDRLNAEGGDWTGFQVQAAVWTGMKARYEDPRVKSATWAESKKKGIAKINDKGKLAVPPDKESQRKHRAIWRKHAMKITSAETVANAKEWAADFSTYLNLATRAITWESLPSPSLGHEILNASDVVKAAYTSDSRDLLVDENGKDILAEKLGIHLAFIDSALGGYMGDVSPSNISHIVPSKPKGDFTKDDARAYASAIQYIFKQNSVPWFRADPNVIQTIEGKKKVKFRVVSEKGNTIKLYDKLSDAEKHAAKKDGYSVKGNAYWRGLDLVFKDSLSGQTVQNVLDLLGEYLGESGLTKTGDKTITVMNFRDDASGLPYLYDETFFAKVAELDETHGESLGIEQLKTFYAESEGGHEQDWESDPQGEEIVNHRSLARRPDLQSWIRDRRNANERLLEEYSGIQLADKESGLLFQRSEVGSTTERTERTSSQGLTRGVQGSKLRLRPDGSLGLVHFSGLPGLQTLDPEKSGTGIKGAESKRRDADPGNFLNRTYFAIEGGGYRKEGGLGPHRYNTSLPFDRLYDFKADPDGLIPKAQALHKADPWSNLVNIYEKVIREEGYAGYWSDVMGQVAAVFEPLTPESYEHQPTPGILFQDSESLYSETLKGIISKDTPTSRALLNTKIENFSDMQQFSYAMNRAALAARHAKVEGKTEGVQKEHATMRAIIQKATDKRKMQGTRRELKARIKRELRNTKAKKGKGKYGPVAQHLLNTLRVASRMTQVEAQDAITTNLEKFQNSEEQMTPEVVMENRVYSMILNLDEMDNNGLFTLLQDIKDFKNDARGNMIAEYEAMQARWEQERADVKMVVSGGKGLPEGFKTSGSHVYESQGLLKDFKRRMKSAGRYFMGWKDLLDILSYNDKSAPGKSRLSAIGDVLDAKNVEKQGVADVMAQFKDAAMRIYGLKSEIHLWRKFNKDSVQVDLGMFENRLGQVVPIKFTKAEARNMIMKLLDPSLDVKFADDMHWTQEIVRAVRGMLDPQDEAFIEWQLEFYQNYYTGVNNVFSKMNGVDLPNNKFYSPLSIEGSSQGDTEAAPSGVSEFLQEMSYRMAPTSGSLIERVGHKNAIKARSDIEVLQSHVLEMEHYKAFAERVRDLNAVLKDGELRQVISLYYGKEMNTLLDFFVNKFARGGADRAGNMRMLDQMRSNFTRSVLAIKPTLTIKQLTSIPAYADAMPIAPFIKNIGLFFLNPVDNFKTMKESSVLLATRGENIERDIKSAAQSPIVKGWGANPAFNNFLMLNIKLGDQAAIVVGGWAYYKYLTDNGASHEDAIRKFEEFTETTQQSADESEQSYVQSSGSWAKLFTMFQSSINQYLRKEMGAIRNLTAGRITTMQAAKTIAIYHFVLPMVFQLVSDRFEWEEDDQLRAAILGPLNGFFIAGEAIDGIIRTALGLPFDDFELSIFAPFKELQKIIRNFKHDDFGAEETLAIIRAAAGAGGAVTGLPAKQVVDLATGISDIAEGDIEQGVTEIFGWSPYKAKELSED